MNKRIVAIVNQKGGVGKTTTAINLAVAVALAGNKVLFVDVDPQANGVSGLGIKVESLDKTLYDIMSNEVLYSEAILETENPNLFVLPSEPDLFGLETELVGKESREFILNKCLNKIKDDYDYIFIDCPPSLTLLTVNALSAADSILVPVQCQYYALEGLSQLLKTLDLCVKGVNPKLVIEGYLLTMYEKGNALSEGVAKEVREHFKEKVFNTMIERDLSLAEAPSFGKSILSYDIRSQGAENYIELANEFLEQYSLVESK